MQSVLREIARLRNGTPIIIDYHNSNRYRLVVQENNGSKTAYYFSTQPRKEGVNGYRSHHRTSRTENQNFGT